MHKSWDIFRTHTKTLYTFVCKIVQDVYNIMYIKFIQDVYKMHSTFQQTLVYILYTKLKGLW